MKPYTQEMFKRLLLFLIWTFVLNSIECEECDKLGTLLYEDLGCEGHRVEGKPCPTHYKCEQFQRSNASCLFQRQQIPVGENVNDSLIYSACRIGCRCTHREDDDTTEFDCAVLDCPEVLQEPIKQDCYYTYSPGECCATGSKCPPFDNVTKCVFDGKEYKEGEQFYPVNSCLTCVCQEGFEGKLEEPFCQKEVCAAQIDNTNKLIDYCAPVYFGSETLCCPSEWACPSEEDRIKRIDKKSSNDSDLTCRWGKQSLKLGEGLETRVEHFDKVKNITCQCILPPLLTCKETKL